MVKRFAAEHSDKVVLFLETENQYSKGVNMRELFRPYIRGKYVAICEGDDWWIDSRKLQRQFDYMESHPEAAACAHAARRFVDSEKRFETILAPADDERDFTTGDLIAFGDNIATNSFFYRSELHFMPDAYNGWGVGDYPASIYLSTCGTFHYSPEVMSVYRVGVKGSWSSRMAASTEANVKAQRRIIGGLETFDRYTGGRYHEYVANAVNDREVTIAVLRRDFKAVKDNARYGTYPLAKRLALWLRCANPRLAANLQKRLSGGIG